jgi:succinate-semialdehyde dehydrogenase/glutarate-semialdehyde dehydrogenase
MKFTSVNPATGEAIHSYDELGPDVVSAAIRECHEVFLSWRRTSMPERSRLFKRAGEVLRKNATEYATLMAEEMGKPIREGLAEVEKCAWVCDYYADKAPEFLRDETVETDATKSFITFQPLGVVLAVMPWNFPFWQVFRFAAPALMAGNGGLLKHASNVPGCALAIEDAFRKAGFPTGIFKALLVGSKQVERLVQDPLVRAVTLTGSTPAGKAVARTAGAMLKKTVLELGGSDPYVILADADLDATVTACVTSRLINAGQSCIAAKRFVVVDSLQQQFEQQFIESMRQQKMGDPMKPETTVGPLARADLRDELHQQVEKSVRMGAMNLLGGRIPDGKGAFYPPSVLSGVKKGMPAYDEELFGPVAAIISAKDEGEAIAIANDSVFGLGAAVFTSDVARGERIAAEELEAGSCFVNAFVKSDPRLPFGGIKESGYGRELSHYGIKEFVNIKAVFVK